MKNKIKKGISIHNFKKGDIIIRLKPVAFIRTYYDEQQKKLRKYTEQYDTSYMTNPYEFIGIENNLIYLKNIQENFFCDIISTCSLIGYSNNWDYFKVPDGLTWPECLSKKKKK
jgi:hypothetical protein